MASSSIFSTLVAVLALVIPSAPVASAAEATTGAILSASRPGSIPGRYIVALNAQPGVEPVAGRAQRLAERYGGTVGFVYRTALHGFSVAASTEQARRIAADPRVAYVQADTMVGVADVQTNPPWGLDRIDERGLVLNKTYEHDFSGRAVTAYVVDTGIRTTHQDFGGRASVGVDTTGGNGQDCNGHGTHVAGIVGGAAHGVAKNVDLVAVRVLGCNGSGTAAALVAGLDWIASRPLRPAVVNLSLGGVANRAVDDAVNRVVGTGVAVVVAAGNANTDACADSPARVPAAITVGATDSGDRRDASSNWGTCVALFAPGADILSTFNTDDRATKTLTGTSMAAPHVSGVVARYLTLNPLATPQQVRTVLTSNATVNQVHDPGNGSPNLLVHSDLPDLPRPGSSALVRYSGHMDIFAVGADNQVWTRWWDRTTGWSDRGRIGTVTAATTRTAVTAVARHPDQMDLFVTDAAGRVWTTWWGTDPDQRQRWHDWFPITGGASPDAPGATVAVVARAPDLMDLFVTDAKGQVLTSWWGKGLDDPHPRWHDWFPLTNGDPNPAAPGAPVSVVARNPELMDLFVTNSKGQVLTTWFSPDPDPRWHDWFAITNGIAEPAAPGAPVSVVARNPGHMDLFTTDPKGQVLTNWFSPDPQSRWHNWFAITNGNPQPATPSATIAAVSRYANQMDLFTPDHSGSVDSNWWHDGLDWATWFEL
jgi:subtilisin family serine protease